MGYQGRGTEAGELKMGYRGYRTKDAAVWMGYQCRGTEDGVLKTGY